MRRMIFAVLAAGVGCAAKPDEVRRDPIRAGQQQLRQGYSYDSPADAAAAGAKSPVQETKTCWRCGGSGKAEKDGSLTTCATCGGSGKTK